MSSINIRKKLEILKEYKRHNHVSGPVVLRYRTTRKTQHSFTYPTEGATLNFFIQRDMMHLKRSSSGNHKTLQFKSSFALARCKVSNLSFIACDQQGMRMIR